MRCPNCHTENIEEDLYCRRCGEDLVVPSTSIVPTQTNLPSVLYNSPLSRGVAASVGALALGVGLELLRRGLLARLTPSPSAAESALPVVSELKDMLFPQNNKALKPPKGYQVEETVVYMRRVIRRGN